ncbi:MAG TPA: glycosyltransferase family 4 protein [Solirubrobacterales bacterium]|nr:glycosyltransferase family 4 protein [Solirubrobacterales bacterium]
MPEPRVLYVNQAAQASGAERSLLALIDGLGERVRPLVACPEGELSAEVRSRGIELLPIRGTEVSFRLHPVHTSRGLLEIAQSSLQVRRIVERTRPDIVHANTTRAALLALLARRRSGPPVLAHIRDWAPEGRFPDLVLSLISAHADAVVANSAYVAERFAGERGERPVRVLHNPIDLARFDPSHADGVAVRADLGIGAGTVVLTVVAQISPIKGQDHAIRVLADLLAAGGDVVLLLVGSVKFASGAAHVDNVGFADRLPRLAAELGVAERVQFLGERADIPDVLAATDILLMPFWQDAFGRVAVEAMSMGVPVAAADAGGPREIVRDGVDGLLLPPHDPGAWAEGLRPLLDSAPRRRELGREGRSRSRDFSLERHAEGILAVYDELSSGQDRLL